jgi:dipeptidase D
LYAVSLEEPFLLASLAGGNAHNAIPREASATVVLTDSGAAGRFPSLVDAEAKAIRKEFEPVDPGLSFEVSDAGAPDSVLDSDSTMQALAFIASLPHGVVSMSYDIPGLVETSTNLATVIPEEGGLEILLSNRSSVDSALKAIRQRIRAAASLVKAEVSEGDGYPGWQPDVSSPILAIVKGVYTEALGEPEVGAVHAGLECGIIGEKIEGMDMISFGPQIEFPHSPDERVHIESVKKFYDVLCTVLERLE